MTPDAPDSPIKPQVIDLQAEDITLEDAAAPAAPPPPPPAATKPKTRIALFAVALLAGAVAGGWIYKDAALKRSRPKPKRLANNSAPWPLVPIN
jgi:hypothetical protein